MQQELCHVHMYRKELPVGEKIATQSTILDSNTDEVENIENNDEQQSGYDSASDEEDLQAEEMASEVGSDVFETTQTPVNFLSKTIRTRPGRTITLSHRALSSYQR